MIQNLSPLDILAMGQVTRWHTTETTRAQTIGEHSARVALLAVWLGHQLGLNRFPALYELETLRLALIHDAPETQYGDVPAPTKAVLEQETDISFDLIVDGLFWEARGCRNPLPAAAHIPRALVRMADILDAAIFYSQAGVTQRRPGCEDIRAELIRQVWKAVDANLPELESSVSQVLEEAGIPATLARRVTDREASA